ncbi:hypothetical protein [uncultured Winogradskyella sp.]|uniref:hypothetical protein n=1 Tax=uncultured Winogradskyella sp. TaxID=395353 RepID=UPI0026234DF7|nr:hypothetical protein [uncultured Winogradskyella sp.]
MDYTATTMTPNRLYGLLKSLSEKELKLLLIIIRQTAGWIERKTGKRKERDYISHRFFMNATGLSSKSVSNGLGLLLQKNLISIETASGIEILTEVQRQSRCRKFYRCLLFEKEIPVKPTVDKQSILRATKLTPTKLKPLQFKKIKQGHRRLTDLERYQQIIGRSVK